MGITGSSLSDLFQRFLSDYMQTETQRKERFDTGASKLTAAAELFGPGYGAGMEHAALTGARQSLIGRGLGGTTRPMAVSAGMKAGFEDLRRGKLATVFQQMAEYGRTFPESTATAGALSHLATGGFSGALQERIAEAPGQPLGPLRYSSGGIGSGSSGGGSSGGGSAGGGSSVGSPNFSSGGVFGSNWSGGGASATTTYGPEGGGPAHQATPGYGLGEWAESPTGEFKPYEGLSPEEGGPPYQSPPGFTWSYMGTRNGKPWWYLSAN